MTDLELRYTATELQACAKRELRLRLRIYPNRVLTGRMTERDADREIAMMAAIVEHYAELAKAERLL